MSRVPAGELAAGGDAGLFGVRGDLGDALGRAVVGGPEDLHAHPGPLQPGIRQCEHLTAAHRGVDRREGPLADRLPAALVAAARNQAR
ncbi:hypothetical protein SANTM175S_05016 [Streptomyces antimycoticus]